MLSPKRKINHDFQIFRPNEEQLNLIRQIQKTERSLPDNRIAVSVGQHFDNFSIPRLPNNQLLMAAEYMRGRIV